MKVTEHHFDPHTILGPADVDARLARSGGLHLSKIYADLEATVAPRDNDLTEEELTYYRSLGFLWEWTLEAAFERSLLVPHCVRPGEFELDGITGSPDLLDLTTDPITAVDSKATFKSYRKSEALEKWFWAWTVQLKGYCAMVGTTRARLLIFHVCGDYKPPRPKVRWLEIEFGQREIEENWAMITGHAKRRGWL